MGPQAGRASPVSESSGTGFVFADLGPQERIESATFFGRIGELPGASTILIRFEVVHPSVLTINGGSDNDFDLLFLSFGLRGPGRAFHQVSSSLTTRLTPGLYAAVVTSSQWRPIAWWVRLDLLRRDTLQARLSGNGQLRGRIGIVRLKGQLRGRGALRARLSRIVRLSCRLGGRGDPRPGIQSAPAPVTTPVTVGRLSHAWVALSDSLIKVGCGDGTQWLSASLQTSATDYPADVTPLAVFEANPGRRLIFSAEAPTVYEDNPAIGPTPLDVTAPASPDYPGLSFLELTSGLYSRRVLLSLPAGGDRQIVVFLQELLQWGNDVVRDLDDSDPLEPRYVVVNRASRFRSSRQVFCWVVTTRAIRRIVNPPAGLLDQLEEVLPSLSGQIVTLPLTVPSDGPPGVQVNCLVPTFIANEEPPSEADVVLTSPPGEPFANLLVSYGLSRLLRSDPSFFSPAVFEFLANAPAILADPDYDPRSYAFVAGALPSLPGGLQLLSPWFQDAAWAESGTSDVVYFGGGSYRLLRYGAWGGPAPVSAAIAANPLDPSWSLVGEGLEISTERLNRLDAPTALIAYDWGQPAACQGSLAAFGFLLDEVLGFGSGDTFVLLGAGGGAVLEGRGLLRATLSSTRAAAVLTARLRGQGRLRGTLSATPAPSLDGFGLLSLYTDLLDLGLT